MLHGKRGVVLPTAAPQVKLRVPHLSFTSFDTHDCKPLQIWSNTSPKTDVIKLPPLITSGRPFFSEPGSADPVITSAYEWAITQNSTPMTVPWRDDNNSSGSGSSSSYLEFDEHVLEQMARMGWNRSHGIAKLVPLACALYDHWRAQ